MRVLSRIILHCSYSEFGDAGTINKWHLVRGFDCVGYHYVILNGQRSHGSYSLADDGLIEAGRDIWRKGAHCKGHNADSIGICLIGRAIFSPLQWRSLKELCCDLYSKYAVRRILGHCELNINKTCPCVRMDAVRKWLGDLWTN